MARWAVALAVAASGWLAAAPVEADSILIQPIQVCDDSGQNCAPTALDQTFRDVTSKIYAQLGHTITFLPLTQLFSTAFLNIECESNSAPCTEAQMLYAGAGNGQTQGAYNMWFVASVTGSFGRGAIGGNGTAISAAVVASNRFDTPAHELGHNLGFNHTDPTIPAITKFVMAVGREIPMSVNDVNPDGLQVDRFQAAGGSQAPVVLPNVTITTSRDSPFLSQGFFAVNFVGGPAGVSLTSLTVDLTPVNAFFDISDDPPGTQSSPFGVTQLGGIADSDITPFGLTDGGQIVTLAITPGAFTVGDGFSFGADIDRFSDAVAGDLNGIVFGFAFSSGYTFESALDQFTTSSVPNLARVPDSTLLLPAQIRMAEGEPLGGPVGVPLPGSVALMVIGAAAGVAARGRRPGRG